MVWEAVKLNRGKKKGRIRKIESNRKNGVTNLGVTSLGWRKRETALVES